MEMDSEKLDADIIYCPMPPNAVIDISDSESSADCTEFRITDALSSEANLNYSIFHFVNKHDETKQNQVKQDDSREDTGSSVAQLESPNVEIIVLDDDDDTAVDGAQNNANISVAASIPFLSTPILDNEMANAGKQTPDSATSIGEFFGFEDNKLFHCDENQNDSDAVQKKEIAALHLSSDLIAPMQRAPPPRRSIKRKTVIASKKIALNALQREKVGKNSCSATIKSDFRNNNQSNSNVPEECSNIFCQADSTSLGHKYINDVKLSDIANNIEGKECIAYTSSQHDHASSYDIKLNTSRFPNRNSNVEVQKHSPTSPRRSLRVKTSITKNVNVASEYFKKDLLDDNKDNIIETNLEMIANETNRRAKRNSKIDAEPKSSNRRSVEKIPVTSPCRRSSRVQIQALKEENLPEQQGVDNGDNSIHTSKNQYSCSLCDRVFKSTRALNCHIRVHSHEKPLQCYICAISFLNSTKLSDHMRMEHEDKLQKCMYCQLKYNYRRSLKRHIIIAHNQNVNNHMCKLCGKFFLQKEALFGHRRFHHKMKISTSAENALNNTQAGSNGIGKKPHTCKTCSKSFEYKSKLQRHMNSHKK